MKHASWCAKTARPDDPKLRAMAAGTDGRVRRVEPAACTCGSSSTAQGLIKLRQMGVMK